MDLETCIAGVLLAVGMFCLGALIGGRKKRNRRIPWHRNSYDSRDRQGAFERIWRV